MNRTLEKIQATVLSSCDGLEREGIQKTDAEEVGEPAEGHLRTSDAE